MVVETKKRNRASNDDESDAEMEFDDDSDRSTISTTVTPAAKSTKDTTETSKAKNTNQTQFSPELLSQYYSRLFPFTLLSQWLSYTPLTVDNAGSNSNSNKLFSHREFSFTIEPSPGDEIYIRYQSYKSQAELTSAILKRQPRKIDIGAIFSHPPKDHHAIQSSTNANRRFQPNQRELVFDIDLTDYDGVRKCGCSGAKICGICWKMMGMAVKVMDKGLRDDFGFEHICWFYSGRRGVHCWVCDESARTLSDPGRTAVANYFEVNLGTEKNQNVEVHNPLHPCLQRAYDILEPIFIKDVISSSPYGHNLLGDPSNDHDNDNATSRTWGHYLLSTLPPSASAVAKELTDRWEKHGNDTTPAEKWDELKRYLKVHINTLEKKQSKKQKKLTSSEKNKIELWPIKQVFKYCYPRLDINVSKMQNHLLKSPFCVHPKTGRVCVPIDVRKVDQFDPFDVPTLPQLMDELDAYEQANKNGDEDDANTNQSNGRRRKKTTSFEWEKTSLNEPFTHFQKEFLWPMLKELKKEEKIKTEKMAAINGDF